MIANRRATMLGCSPSAALKAAFRVVRACRVDVEIDHIDAALRLVVAVASVPRPISQANVADLGEPEATPLTSRWQIGIALSAKLIGQRLFAPLRMAEDNRAELAMACLVCANDLFPVNQRLLKQLVNGAGRGRVCYCLR